jgi:hypothetical protein
METYKDPPQDEYRCELCNKVYKNKSGLWKHNNKYHNNVSTQMSTIGIHSGKNGIQNVYKMSTDNKNTICKHCGKELSNRQSKWRHEKTCNDKNQENDKDKVIEKLQTTLETQQKMINEQQNMCKKLLELINQNCKVHPKTLQKINKNLLANNNNSCNNNSGNINNGTINNTYNIVKFGSENIDELLSKSELFNILNQRYLSIEKSIQTVHFNDKYPTHKNILITNLRDNIAYIYDGKQYSAVPKTQALNELIDIHTENIEVSLTNYREKLPPKTIEILEKLLEKIRDDNTPFVDGVNDKNYKNYKSYKINEIKLMVYNESDKNKSLININCDIPLQNSSKSIEV